LPPEAILWADFRPPPGQQQAAPEYAEDLAEPVTERPRVEHDSKKIAAFMAKALRG